MLVLAMGAYNAYGETTDFKNYQGLPMPPWDALPEAIQNAWIAAASYVFNTATQVPNA